jgi:AraC-like DNA-binding protein
MLRFLIPICIVVIVPASLNAAKSPKGTESVLFSVGQPAESQKKKIPAIDTIAAGKGEKAKPAPADSSARRDTAKAVVAALKKDTVKNSPDTLKKAAGAVKRIDSLKQKPRATVTVAKEKKGAVKHGSRLGAGTKAAALIVRRYAAHICVLCVSLAIIALTLLFFRRKEEGRRFMTTTRLSIMDREVQLACRHIERYFCDRDLSRDSVCASLRTGAAFLEMLFEKELGMTIDDFIIQVRINRSRSLLEKNPRPTAAELAAATGFADQASFLRSFSEIAGMPFESYRSTRDPQE